ncbi:disintegrin and metalloproteinase domain-containing protein 2-like [Chroicocephalus ridibundus]|uniref:disintegrin and metalloproteinase domain-containing protein 2-like n=1 Tax=Chroicocephalus ridibundus TaxID=1192867 RepID=UPI002FDDAAD2
MGLHQALLLLLLSSPVLAQVTVPLRLPTNATGEGRALGLPVRQRGLQDLDPAQETGQEILFEVLHFPPFFCSVFLSDDFRIYVSNEKGSLRPDSTLFKGGCHYSGYVEGFPSSAVTLSTCSGLRGLLQFENVSYGIEPLGHSPAFEHFVYRVRNEKAAGSLLATSPPEGGPGGLTAEEMASKAPGGDRVSGRLLPRWGRCPRHTRGAPMPQGALAGGVWMDGGQVEECQCPLPAEARSPKYFKVYVVLDKALYSYMGSDTNAAMQKIIQVFNLVNSEVMEKIPGVSSVTFQMFNPLNVTIVLSSLELWKEENKISTAGEADVLLQRFLQWKQSHLAQRPYDIACLSVYRDRAEFVGATALGKACQRDAAGAVAVYQRAVMLESFSALLAQLLARSLGVNYDDPRECRCPGSVCIMTLEALKTPREPLCLVPAPERVLEVHRDFESASGRVTTNDYAQGLYFRGSSGAKAFSNCSIEDFETFLRHGGGACLFHPPRLTGLSYRRAPVCGNGVVEPGEQCDCGAAEACLKDKCCTKTCRFKPGAECSSGLCCSGCQFKRKNSPCRPAADAQCDLAEFCNGSSASCPPDLYVQDGHGCEHGTGYCYKGRCRSPDLQCRQLYGRGSKNAPMTCYEEINSQRDRFGHCGLRRFGGYKPCARRDLRCGKLICTYPHSSPLPSVAAAVLYAQVRKHLCVSMDYFKTPAKLDPLLVPPGTKCGSGKVCINGTCHPHSVLGSDCDSKVKCHGHGVCNNEGHCHCHPGWQPPDCLRKGSRPGGSIDSSLQVTEGGLSLPQTTKDTTLVRTVLGFCLPLLILTGAACLVLWCCRQQTPSTEGSATEEGSDPSEPDPEPELDIEPELESEPEPEPEPGPSPGPRRGR